MNADWYFDFISPYAYLQFTRLSVLQARLDLTMKPVLLAALLGHWGQLGPAEIGPKRRFVYAQTRWLARRQGVELTMPEAHPFNPLRLLRLALHLGVTREVVERIFAFVWREGRIPENEESWRQLTRALGVADGDAAVAGCDVKAALRRNTEEAIAAGVFGVPTIVLGGQLFWGNDATRMVLDYLDDPEVFRRDDLRAKALPVAASRAAGKRTQS